MMMQTLLAATAVFTQIQLKYGAQRDDFLHRWYDRPLHQDSSYVDADDGSFLNLPAWRKTAETLRLGGMDGVAYFVGSAQRGDVLAKSLVPGGETGILFELAGYTSGVDGCVEAAGKALTQPNYYKIDGKCVLPLRGEKTVACTAAFAAEVKRRVTEKYGDRFLIMPFNWALDKKDFKNGEPKAEQKERAKAALRDLLRVSDGFFLIGGAFRNRRFDGCVFDTVVGPLIREVLDEDEFRGKKRLGCSVTGGHENTYRWQYFIDSVGTATLCDHLDSMLKLKPDFIICQEWDEENENTCFRPTVFNGFTTQRIVRHFSDMAAGKAPSVFPGDNVSIPNLILSYRKSLALGEAIEVEVRNIPDGTFPGETFTVSFSWLDTDGHAVKTYPAEEMKADTRSSVWFKSPATEMAEYRTLTPRLTVCWSSGSRDFSYGLFMIDVNATRCMDHKWVKQPLREIPKNVRGEISVGEKDAEGAYTVRGKVSSPRRIRTVEVLDDMDTAYVHSDTPEVPEGFEQIRVQFQGLPINTKANAALNGTITFSDAEGVRLKPSLDKGSTLVPVQGNAWIFNDLVCNQWGALMWALVPRSAIAACEVVVDLPPHFKGTVKLADLMERDVYGFNSVDGCGLTVMRYLPTAYLPRPLMKNEAEFAFRWKPIEKTSVLRLQIIDEDYHVWRGQAKTVWRPSGSTVTLNVFDRESAKTAPVVVDAARVEEVVCDFASDRGSAFFVGSGRALAGMRGSSAALAQTFGWGESLYGQPLARSKYLKPGHIPAKGWGCFSQQLIPGFSGFALDLSVKPNGFGRRQGLLSSGNCGIEVLLNPDGTVLAELSCGRRFFVERGSLLTLVKGPSLRAGEWNRISLVTDRKTAYLEVNGVRGDEVAYQDYFPNQRYTLVGAEHPDPNFFDGEIGNFSVSCK